MYICSMSLTKRWIEEERMAGRDPLNDMEIDVDYEYEQYLSSSIDNNEPHIYDDGYVDYTENE